MSKLLYACGDDGCGFGDAREGNCTSCPGRDAGEEYVDDGSGPGEICPSDGRLDCGADLTSGKGNACFGGARFELPPDPKLALEVALPDLSRPCSLQLSDRGSFLLVRLSSRTSLAILCKAPMIAFE